MAIESRLKNVGAKTYKTPLDCDISVKTNGVKHSVSNACKNGKKLTAPAAKPAAKPLPKVTPKPVAKPKPSTRTNFKNCTDLRMVYPSGVSKDHAAYQSKMDRDKDGWACER